MTQKKLLEDTADNLIEIRELIERGELDEALFPLHTFRYDSPKIGDIVSELYECI